MVFESNFKPSGQIDPDSLPERVSEISHRMPSIDHMCEAIAVIPVYREFIGGRISSLLGELEAQGIGSRRFEVILVVNNPNINQKHKPIEEEGLRDNLSFLEFIRSQKEVGRFPNIHVLNCTNGEIPRRHMGLVRGFGQLVAEGRLDNTEKGDNGIIIQLDADCSIDKDFLSGLFKAYQDPVVCSAMVGRLPLPIDFSGSDFYLTYAANFAEAVEWSFLKGSNWEYTRPQPFIGDGPTLSFRSSVHKLTPVRGYMSQYHSEDFKLAGSLARAGGMHLLAEPRVYKGDRERVDGFDSTLREGWINWAIYWSTIQTLIDSAFQNVPIFKRPVFSERQFNFIPQTIFWSTFSGLLAKDDPEAAVKLQIYLNRERELAEKHMDWDVLSSEQKIKALYLYGLSRLAMGEVQRLMIAGEGKEGHFPSHAIYIKNEMEKSSKEFKPFTVNSTV